MQRMGVGDDERRPPVEAGVRVLARSEVAQQRGHLLHGERVFCPHGAVAGGNACKAHCQLGRGLH